MAGRAIRTTACAVLVATILGSSSLQAAEQWIEVKSANFTVISNAGDRSTRKLVWQLEQVRSAMAALWSWARPDLNKPLSVILIKDEISMRALAPQYWERGGSVRPASLWVTGADQHYLVVRADVQADDKETINPYVSAYFSYIGLILDQSFDRDLPFWLRRGLTGVLSNTIVREDRILVGPFIPWHLRHLRERGRQPLAKLLEVSRRSPSLKQSEFLEGFDAQTWALVHFLMFGEEGRRAPQLNAFVKLVTGGKDPGPAFAETLGPLEPLEAALLNYIQRNVFSYTQVNIDVSVERERFPVRPLPPAESASARALFHAAMRRPVECRAAIAEARKADANAAASYTAEGLLFDQEAKPSDAKAAYAKAVELSTPSAYTHYRLAALMWEPRPSPETLKNIDTLLSKAVARNVRYAAAYAWLGDVRASLGSDDGITLIRRAISLEPRESSHRLRAASVLLNQGKAAEARVDAQAALALAEEDDDRKDAQQLLARIAKAGEAR
jgi:hypothetical protein